MAEIVLTNGKITLVDEEDFFYLNEYRWRQHNYGYVITAINRKTVYIHRLILNSRVYTYTSINKKKCLLHKLISNLEDKMEIDHINHNKLDNRRENLRIATRSQNTANQLKSKGRTSQYKGVHKAKGRNKWRTSIGINNKNIKLGYYTNEIEAAKKYDEAAKKLFGEFALVNFR